MQWVDMRKYSDSLKRDGEAFDSSDERITTALSRPGLYIVRFNKIDDNGTHVIKLGRTDITDDANLINRMRDYHGANAFSHSVVAFGLTRRRKFDSEETKNATSASRFPWSERSFSSALRAPFNPAASPFTSLKCCFISARSNCFPSSCCSICTRVSAILRGCPGWTLAGVAAGHLRVSRDLTIDFFDWPVCRIDFF